MYEHIDYDVAEHIATVFLNRPGKKNAYTPHMGMEIVAALEAAMDDNTVRVAILSGRGDAFCAGVDLDFLRAHMAGEDTGPGPKLGEEHLVNGWPLDLAAYPKPVIAAINGTAFGVGVTMTLGCDVRYAAAGATLGLNFTTLGVLPGLGSTHHLPQLVGVGKAMELILSGARLSAEEAFEIGLVQRLCPKDEVYNEARKLAQAMMKAKPEVLAAAKKALRHGATSSLEAAIATEKSLSRELDKSRREAQ
ncbi:MAG TPA: enoyl-CoA hydratase/isomerase family protein [Halioglobus sp.]